MSQHLLDLVLALAASELVHNAIESQNVREKVKRLKVYMAGESYKELPVNINTRAKSYFVSLLGLVIITGIFYVIFSLLKLSTTHGLQVTALLLILAYIVTAVIIDKYHVDIEQVTKPFRNPKKS